MRREPEQLLRPEDLEQVRDLGLIARWIVEGTILGQHRSPVHGLSVEFAEYREYAPGDDLRHFDWKAFGRSDRRYIKKFHTETNTRCHLVVDSSASMDFGKPSKLHYARCLAAAVAHVASRQQDSVGLTVLQQGAERRLPPGGGQAHLATLVDMLASTEPGERIQLGRLLDDLARTLGTRGLIVLFSDLYDDDGEVLDAIRHLRFRGHEVVVFHVMHRDELRFDYERLRDFVDLESGERIEVHGPTFRDEYRRLVQEWLGNLETSLGACRAEYVLAETSRPFAALLAEYLHRRRTLEARR